MDTDRMIWELRRLAKKHENDKVYTGENNWSLMCTDVANRLEELDKENKELKSKLENIMDLEQSRLDDGK